MLFEEYFLKPLFRGEGYNPINTSVYALILAISVLLIFKTLKRLRIKINEKFATSIAPFVLLGSSLRVLVDAGILATILLVSPFIYVTVFSITFTLLLLSLFIQQRMNIDYSRILFCSGISLSCFPLALIPYKNPLPLILLPLCFSVFLILNKFKWKLSNKIVFCIHFFDSMTTTFAISFYSYLEQHFLPRFLIQQFGVLSFPLFKLLAVIVFLWVVDKYHDLEFSRYLKLIVGILGASTGTRDFLRILALV